MVLFLMDSVSRWASGLYALLSRALPGFALMLSLYMLMPASAYAGCVDAPAPGIDWSRCHVASQDLSGVDMAGALLRDTSFRRSGLDGANMAGVKAPRSEFIRTNLRDTDFSGADLRYADFTRTEAVAAIFVGADLRKARFFKANLADADFTGARVEGVNFRRADLSGALWIDGKKRCRAGSIGRCF